MAKDRTIKAHNDHNVYILGAGFSAEAGLPLIKDFMNRMRDAAAWLETKGGREREIQAIESVLEFRLQAAAAAYRVPIDVENIEELFSLVSASGDRELVQAMPLAIAATLDYAQTTAPSVIETQGFSVGSVIQLEQKPDDWGQIPSQFAVGLQNEQPKRDWHSCPSYDSYLGLMCGYFNKRAADRRETIITFNYDLLIEEALNHLGIEYNYVVTGNRITETGEEQFEILPLPTTGLPLLKLHGSVNWVSPEITKEHPNSKSKSGNTQTDLQHLVRSVAGSFQQISVFEKYEALRRYQADQRPYLVPPTWSKSLQAPLTVVWDAAVKALRTATRVIILGYSIPLTDQHFRYLLAAGLQGNISLRKVFFVNPALADGRAEIQLKERLFGRLGLLREEHLEQGVVELVPLTVRQFFGESNDSAGESCRLRIGRPFNPQADHYKPDALWRCYSHSGGGAIFV